MENKPLVSFLMNCHNGEKYLKLSLDSIFDQEYQNFEIIFYDNYSTDNSLNILNKYNDERIRYFKSSKKLTLSCARVEAWKFINGDLVAILDTDDMCSPNRLLEQIDYFQKDKDLAVLGGNCYIIDENNKIRSKTSYSFSNSKLKEKLHYSFPFNNSTLMFRKDYVDLIGGYSNKFTMINDYVLVYNLSLKYNVNNTNKFISYNRSHKDNLSNKEYYTWLAEQYGFLKGNLYYMQKSEEIQKNKKIYISRLNIKILLSYFIKLNFLKIYIHLKNIKIFELYYFIFKPN